MASIFPFFVPAIRDYIDLINNAYDTTVGNINLLQLLQQNVIYLITSIKFLIFYFFSFQWIRDLSYLPIIVPQIKLEILKEHFFLQSPQSNFFTFLEIPSYTNNKFFLGFVNSFFLCLPLSVAHVISLRRLLIQGLSAGLFSNLGTICGQTLLLICVLFGGRFFITPWFNFQVFTYFFGLWLILKTIYDICHERSIRIIDKNNIPALTKIFLLNFALSWTEQSCIFQYFGNLTLGPEPSIIEIFSSLSVFQSILTHISYLCGIIIGSMFFTSVFIFFTLKLNTLCIQLLSILYSRWIRRLNSSLILIIIAVTFTSIPFYSFDYLILSNFGFVAQDKSFQNTIFSPTKTYDYWPPILGDTLNFYADRKAGIDTDITPFNKTRYLMFDVNDSFEQLNYQGEYAWLTKRNRIPNITRNPSSSRVFSKISKFFKKNKKLNNSIRNIQNSKFKESGPQILNNNFENRPDFNTLKKVNVFPSNGPKRPPLYVRSIKDNFLNDSFEKLINKTTLHTFFITTFPPANPIMEKKFQLRYYSNPIYKLLLSTDIDFFLSRQPKYISLSPKQEHDLFKKRSVLANYYDSLRYYDILPYEENFTKIFHGSKSYADRVYNHQFNGTLKIVRRLFLINEKKSNKINSQLDMNQTLFSKNRKLQIKKNEKTNENFFTLKFDQPLYKKIPIMNFVSFQKYKSLLNDANKLFFHEEFNMNRKLNVNKNKISKKSMTSNYEFENSYSTMPFIELTNPTPFYIGWDEQLRKLVVTNRLSSKKVTGESMKFANKNQNFIDNEYFDLNKFIKKNKTIVFTSWPFPTFKTDNTFIEKKLATKSNLQKHKLHKKISYNFLIDLLQDSQNFNLYNNLVHPDFDLDIELNEDGILENTYGELSSIPSNILSNPNNSYTEVQDIMPYTRGGFVWPGHSNLKLKFKNLLSNKLQNK